MHMPQCWHFTFSVVRASLSGNCYQQGERAMQLPLTGGCQCGQIRYEITEQPSLVYACHCTDCQHITSSAFSLGAALPDAAFRLTSSEPRAIERVADSGRLNTRFVCLTVRAGCSPSRAAAWPGCVPAASTTLRGYDRRGTSGRAVSSPGSRSPKAMRYSRGNRPMT